MGERNYKLHNGRKGAAIAVRVIPRASKNQIVGALQDGTLKINIASAVTEGHANEELIAFLAGILDITKDRIEVVAGDMGRDKLVSVLDMDSDTLQRKIVENIE
jgi:uncharacterized protein